MLNKLVLKKLKKSFGTLFDGNHESYGMTNSHRRQKQSDPREYGRAIFNNLSIKTERENSSLKFSFLSLSLRLILWPNVEQQSF